MRRRFITAVKPLDDHILQVEFISGSLVLLDLKPHLQSLRFFPLTDPAVWNAATTNGVFVRFGHVELSHDEILAMLEHPPNAS